MRFDPAPLVAAVGDATFTDVADTLRINARTWRGYLRGEGSLTAEAADRYAVRLGKHPGEIWPEWWEVAS